MSCTPNGTNRYWLIDDGPDDAEKQVIVHEGETNVHYVVVSTNYPKVIVIVGLREQQIANMSR